MAMSMIPDGMPIERPIVRGPIGGAIVESHAKANSAKVTQKASPIGHSQFLSVGQSEVSRNRESAIGAGDQ